MQEQKIEQWEPNNFRLESSSVWSFPVRGSWATHDSTWRGNWSPYIPRNVLLRYSKEGDLVLDQFAGGGTTLIEAKLLNCNIIGVDINENAIARCKEKTSFIHCDADGRVFCKKGDARDLSFIISGSIDLICTHPPYANIIQYSADTPGDLSRFSIPEFLLEMEKVAQECYRVLKDDGYCAILMGDIRQKGFVVPLGFEVMKVFENAGFRLKENVIKQQHNCHTTTYWKSKNEQKNFLLLAHEYLFVLKKVHDHIRTNGLDYTNF